MYTVRRSLTLLVQAVQTFLTLGVVFISVNSYCQLGDPAMSIRENTALIFSEQRAYNASNLVTISHDTAIHTALQRQFKGDFLAYIFDTAAISNTFLNKPENLVIQFEGKNNQIVKLKLVRYNLSKNDSIGIGDKSTGIVTGLPLEALFYRGVAENFSDRNWVSLTLGRHSFSFLLADSGHNLNFEYNLNNAKYAVFYSDHNVKNRVPFTCQNDVNTTSGNTTIQTESNSQTNRVEPPYKTTSACPIQLEWTFDYNYYYNFGANLQSYALSTFNNVGALYQNHQIQLLLDSIFWHSQPNTWMNLPIQQLFENFGFDVHNNGGLGSINPGDGLATFFQGNLNGNMGTTGLAVIDALCDKFYSTNGKYVGLDPTYTGRFSVVSMDMNTPNAPYPYYSFLTSNVGHELGHNIGSRHTHWCGWTGGPIDGCNNSYPEVDNFGQGCAPGPLPGPYASSVMSYCGSIYGFIDLSYGFGPQPSNVLFNKYQQKSCCMYTSVENTIKPTSSTPLFPNPVNTSFEIYGDKQSLDGSLFKITTMDGRGVKTGIYNGPIDVSEIESGYYLLTFTDKNAETHYLKFIKY